MSAPELQTARLTLSLPALGDLDGVHACYASPEASRFLGGLPMTMADTFGRLLRGAGSWSLYGYGAFYLRLHGQSNIAGICGVFHSWRGFGEGMDDVAEAGWAIHPDLWGQGLAFEAMSAALEWFDVAHDVRRTVCMIEEGHRVSERLAARLGYLPYGQHDEPDGTALMLYERLSGK